MGVVARNRVAHVCVVRLAGHRGAGPRNGRAPTKALVRLRVQGQPQTQLFFSLADADAGAETDFDDADFDDADGDPDFDDADLEGDALEPAPPRSSFAAPIAATTSLAAAFAPFTRSSASGAFSPARPAPL